MRAQLALLLALPLIGLGHGSPQPWSHRNHGSPQWSRQSWRSTGDGGQGYYPGGQAEGGQGYYPGEQGEGGQGYYPGGQGYYPGGQGDGGQGYNPGGQGFYPDALGGQGYNPGIPRTKIGLTQDLLKDEADPEEDLGL